jgi:RecA/RadA recombinase
MNAKQLKSQLTKKRKKEDLSTFPMISSGIPTLNMLCTGKSTRCIPIGSYVLMVGDSAAGKTFLSLHIMAVAANNPKLDDYLLVHDDAEGGAQMDKERFFGKKAAKRIIAPAYSEGRPIYSETLEQFYDRVDALLDEGEPFIYCMDSQDVLTTTAEIKKVDEQRKAREKGNKETGSMSDAKAKIHSQRLRKLIGRLRRNKSILIILSQTRDNMGFGSQFDPKTRAGGNALRFYADLELWLSIKKRLKKKVRDKDRKIGIISNIVTKKNRINGREGAVEVPIYYSHGVDPTGACVNYLIEEKHWKGTDAKVTAPDFEFSGSKEKLITMIEQEGYEKELNAIVKEVWNEIEQTSMVQRVKRFE